MAELGGEATVEKVEDLREVTQSGVTATPALVVDGKVRVAGMVLTPTRSRSCCGLDASPASASPSSPASA